jgi:hypothetical protein
MINMSAKPIELPSYGMVSCIQRVVAGSYGLTMEQLMSNRRDCAWPRQVAMYLARELTPKSYPSIGRLFNRDHTTVIHACHRVEFKIATDPLHLIDVEALREALTPKPVETGDKSLLTLRNSQEHVIEQDGNKQEERLAA